MNTTLYRDYTSCIEACMLCASTCNYCASSCTREEDTNMIAKCIDKEVECAEACRKCAAEYREAAAA
jgi:hypothetical protein